MSIRRPSIHFRCDDETPYPVIPYAPAAVDVDRLVPALEALSAALHAVREPLRPALARLTGADLAAVLKALPVARRGHALEPLGIGLSPRSVSPALGRDVLARLARDPASPRVRHALRHLTEPLEPVMFDLFWPDYLQEECPGGHEPPSERSPDLARVCLWARCTASVADAFLWHEALRSDGAAEGLDPDEVARVIAAAEAVIALTPAADVLTEAPPDGAAALPAVEAAADALRRAVADAAGPAQRVAKAVDCAARPADEDLAAIRRLAEAFDETAGAFAAHDLDVPAATVEAVESAVAELAARTADQEARAALAEVLDLAARPDSPAVPLLERARQRVRDLLAESSWTDGDRTFAQAMTALVDLRRALAGPEVSAEDIGDAMKRWSAGVPDDLMRLAMLTQDLAVRPAADGGGAEAPEGSDGGPGDGSAPAGPAEPGGPAASAPSPADALTDGPDDAGPDHAGLEDDGLDDAGPEDALDDAVPGDAVPGDAGLGSGPADASDDGVSPAADGVSPADVPPSLPGPVPDSADRLPGEPEPEPEPATPTAPQAADAPVAVSEPGPPGAPQRPADPGASGPAPSLPWSDGAEPTVAVLIGQGRLAEAYWLTRAAGESADRARALAFAAAAFGAAGDTAASAALMAYNYAPEQLADDREALLVALTAALRAGLTAGWPSALVTGFSGVPGLPERWQDLLAVLVEAVRECRRLEPGSMNLDSEPRVAHSRVEIGDLARQLLADLPRRTIKYQRGTRVLQRLAGKDGALHRTLVCVAEWAEGSADAADLLAEADRYRKADAGMRVIEEADRACRTPKQAREQIKAAALRQLQNAVTEVHDLLARACNVAAAGSASGAPSAETALAPVVNTVRDEPAPPGPGGAALHLLLRWLRHEAPPAAERPLVPGGEYGENGAYGAYGAYGEHAGHGPYGGHGETPYGGEPTAPVGLTPDGAAPGDPAPGGAPGPGPVPSADCLLVLPDLPRHDSGEPDLAHPDTARLLADVTEAADPVRALAAYRTRGDLHLAHRLLAALERGAVAEAERPAEDQLAALRQQTADAAAQWRDRVRAGHAQVGTLLAQVRTLNLLDQDKEHEFTGRLQDLARPDASGRYRAALREVADLTARLTALIDEHTAALRRELAELDLGPADHDRVAALIADGDTVTAGEFLSFARRGRPLPEHPRARADDLAEFLRVLSAPDAPRPSGQGVSARWWAQGYAGGTPLTEGAKSGLQAWDALCDPSRRGSEWQRHVPQVLRLLGLETQPVSPLESERPTRGVQRLRARATVSEATPGYVAVLGSRATTYTVLLISEEQRGGGPLAHLEDADLEANIVLYLHPLGLAGRDRLAEESRGRPQQALVVDPAVLGWTAARAPRSFRALQRVTLPWTCYNPYTPFVAGLVPPEVFYGRDKEMREVMDRDGRLFVYGGRQLGKSALLRRAAGVFPQRNPDHVALYVDLLKAEIGQAEPPERIWGLFASHLRDLGVLRGRARGPQPTSAKAVSDGIREWLRDNPNRRLLVLADEADAFLTADSRPEYTRGGQSTFPHFTKLQQLMEETGRRFKVVFAGLHQVQRFGHLQNVVVVHGGPDIPVGPLDPRAALQLVVEPIAALGYVFERPELAWRVLAITNYQANLVQIFCSELVRALHARPAARGGRPTAITEQDVRSVAGSDVVRQRIAERLRFTINLEDRYRVLALVIALESLEKGYSTSYRPKELLDRAREVWAEGFDTMSVSQIRIYLEEMEGLGLLIQLPDQGRFAVRSPNVVNMLGTREELEAELKETEFGLPYDYNPRASRRLIGLDRQGVLRYSPLTEGQLNEAVRRGVTVVAASALFQPPLILRAASACAEGRGARVLTHQAGADVHRAGADVTLTLAPLAAARGAYFLLADLSGADPRTLNETVAQLVRHLGTGAGERPAPGKAGGRAPDERAALVVADPDAAAGLTAAGVPVVRPERWTVDSLRSWPECPFASLDERRRLIAATGGWPHLVERVIAEVRGGATLEAALDKVRQATSAPEAARAHLRLSGLDAGLVDLVALWSAYVNEGEAADTAGVAAAMDIDLSEAEKHLARLADRGMLDEREEGVALDPVTFRAVSALGPEA
ncbi:hypothetical protein RKE29_04470 [Streptomyces sp. B1866]|uniref:hypothetical protein n=1 Tax=Streptomyces sp. B1866 TaxID=3075431 RepID=UPI00288F194F|nr:hypothetical protein [Streptomyces sp. B1866]MDT3395904.1 hypothetical protein [Streptomyces sp. B1866]